MGKFAQMQHLVTLVTLASSHRCSSKSHNAASLVDGTHDMKPWQLHHVIGLGSGWLTGSARMVGKVMAAVARTPATVTTEKGGGADNKPKTASPGTVNHAHMPAD